jgi:hypothetical protein
VGSRTMGLDGAEDQEEEYQGADEVESEEQYQASLVQTGFLKSSAQHLLRPVSIEADSQLR